MSGNFPKMSGNFPIISGRFPKIGGRNPSEIVVLKFLFHFDVSNEKKLYIYIYIYIYVCGETCFNKWKLSEMIIKRKKQGVIISLLFSVPIHVG